jgi:hypothetical protein
VRCIGIDTKTFLYRRERGALAPNLTNVGQVPHNTLVTMVFTLRLSRE